MALRGAKVAVRGLAADGREGAADGFNYRVSSPREFAVFLDEVVPILRERGLVRSEYEQETLRGHLGLPIPTNRRARAIAAE